MKTHIAISWAGAHQPDYSALQLKDTMVDLAVDGRAVHLHPNLYYGFARGICPVTKNKKWVEQYFFFRLSVRNGV